VSLPDIRIETHGTIALIRGHTPAGEEWLREHVAFEHFFGGAGVAEPRFVNDIIDGASRANLELEIR
jgi:hypothetical protein